MRSGIEINGISLLSAHIIGKKNTAVSFSISEFKKQNKTMAAMAALSLY
jgi:hypothetical protein